MVNGNVVLRLERVRAQQLLPVHTPRCDLKLATTTKLFLFYFWKFAVVFSSLFVSWVGGFCFCFLNFSKLCCSFFLLLFLSKATTKNVQSLNYVCGYCDHQIYNDRFDVWMIVTFNFVVVVASFFGACIFLGNWIDDICLIIVGHINGRLTIPRHWSPMITLRPHVHTSKNASNVNAVQKVTTKTGQHCTFYTKNEKNRTGITCCGERAIQLAYRPECRVYY